MISCPWEGARGRHWEGSSDALRWGCSRAAATCAGFSGSTSPIPAARAEQLGGRGKPEPDYRFSRCAGGRVYVIPRAPPRPTHGPAPLLSAVGISAVCGRVGDPSRSAHYFPTTGAACITGGTRAAAAHSPEPGGHRHRRGSVLQRRRRVWVSLNRCSSRLGKFRGRGARGAARSGSSFKPTGLPPPGSAGGARAADVPGARGSPARGGGSGHALPPRLPRRCLFAS